MGNVRYAFFDEETETYDVKCECGHRKIYKKNGIQRSKKCPSCKTTKIIIESDEVELEIEEFEFSEYERVIDTKTEKKLNIIYEGDQGNKKVITVHYDLITHSLKVGENGELRELEDKFDSNRFFGELEDVEEYDLIEELGLDEYEDFFEDALGIRLFNYVKKLPVQILLHDGFTWEDFIDFDSSEITESSETQPHKILGVHKCLYEVLKNESYAQDYMDEDVFVKLQKISQKYDGSDVKTALDMLKDLGQDFLNWNEDMFDLLIEENYPSMQKFIRYLFIETKFRQGMDDPDEVIEYLRDMISMAKEMEFEYNLMPKSLKLEHDVIMMQHEVARTKIEKKKFANVIAKNDYQALEFQDENFMIITPKEADELVKEGKQLNHCVASYFNRVIQGDSKILFMRDKKKLEVPLVTIEVCGRTVMQARGRSNRDVNKEEDKFIKKWAKERKLIV